MKIAPRPPAEKQASTPEAKLQSKLATIPLFRVKEAVLGDKLWVNSFAMAIFLKKAGRRIKKKKFIYKEDDEKRI